MLVRGVFLLIALSSCALGCGDGSTTNAPRDASTDARTTVDAPLAIDVGNDASLDAWAPPRCGDGVVNQASETCDDGNADPFDGCLSDCTEPPVIGPPDRTWTWYPIPGTQCIDGTETGFGVSTVAGATDLMVYLEGGGACFNDSCDFTALSVPFVPPPDGIFDRTRTENPVRNWNMVYIPYCTGDIYGGDRDTMLAGQIRHFHGYRNIGLDLQAIVPAFPHVTRVLWTGISAGGFGSALNAGRAADAFGSSRQMILIDDSGPPFGNDVIAPCLEQIFRDTWGLDDTILAACGAACPDPTDFATGASSHLLSAYPNMRVGIFSNTADTVIRTFMGFGWYDGQHDHCTGIAPSSVPIQAYTDGLVHMRAAYPTRASFFLYGTSRIPGNGLGHTTLRTTSYYDTSIDGVSVADWVGSVIEGTITQVGP